LVFVCNLASHWFTIRKIGGYWWNLNSLLKNGPEFVGEFYLSAFLETLIQEGYSIFVVRGVLQKGENLGGSFGGERGIWVTRAPPNSTQSTNQVPFASQGYVLGGTRVGGNFQGEETGLMEEEGLMAEGEDLEFQRALQLSLETAQEEKKKKLPSEPEPGEDITQVLIRGPSGELKRRFHKTEKLTSLSLFLEASGIDLNSYKLFTSHPSSTPLHDLSLSFEEAGLHPRSVLILKL